MCILWVVEIFMSKTTGNICCSTSTTQFTILHSAVADKAATKNKLKRPIFFGICYVVSLRTEEFTHTRALTATLIHRSTKKLATCINSSSNNPQLYNFDRILLLFYHLDAFHCLHIQRIHLIFFCFHYFAVEIAHFLVFSHAGQSGSSCSSYYII